MRFTRAMLIGAGVAVSSCTAFIHFDGGADSNADTMEDASRADSDANSDAREATVPDASCAAGFGDCNGLSTDGCETPLNTTSNCNACGMACGTMGTAAVTCTATGCSMTCAANFADCDGDPRNGCERAFDINHCGSCNLACAAGQICCYSLSHIPGDCQSGPNC